VRLAPRHREFLSGMARHALFRRPPPGLFRDFAVEAGGEHAGTLDLKTGAAALFVDAARVYALAAGVGSPSTEDRLRLAAGAAGLDHREAEALVEAFHFVQVLRLRSQLDLGRAGEAPHNRIDPYALNPLERRFFRESLRLAAAIQRRMERDFAGEAPRG
jgi:CBS domain-containing protein